ncbi:hypothetical protein QAD02_023855 [Eretmocerus hayati]|uniref:Uncharacterized protein n=1 Tax=Eretmocerus hayati TaxID=131215 RepID=A0ACC2PWT1_9HYME|nr:hypothetical protein QAD02_023855 [Eretmocerus hayati]
MWSLIDKKIHLASIILFITPAICVKSNNKCLIEMDRVVRYISEKMSVYKVNIISESSRNLSAPADAIVNYLSAKFPSELIDFEELKTVEMKLQDSYATDDLRHFQQVKSFKNYQRHISERRNLAIVILDVQNDTEMSQRLNEKLSLLDNLTVGFRGKYIFVLISETNHSFKNFLQFAWSWKFLDLTIIELVNGPINRIRDFNNSIGVSCTGSMHTFNPFIEQYNLTDLNAESIIFPQKLENLDGYTLYVTVTTNSPHSYPLKDHHEVDTGYDFFLTQTLTEILNAKMMMAPHTNNFSLWYMNATSIGAVYNFETLVDFEMYIYYDELRPEPRNSSEFALEIHYNAARITLPTQVSYYLLLRRPVAEPQIELSSEAVLAYTILFVTGVFLATLAGILGFKEKNWSLLNIITAQMGSSLKHQGKMKSSEKFYLITMYIATFIVTSIVTDQMVEIFIYRQETSDFKTLQDLADSDVELILDSMGFDQLSKMNNHQSLGKILNRSKIIESSDLHGPFCHVSSLYHRDIEGINLCLWNDRDRIPIPNPERGWYIDRIEEPVEVLRPQLAIPKTNAFFRDRFEVLLQRLFETGFDTYWNRASRRDLISEVTYLGGDPSGLIDDSLPKKEDEEDVPLKYQLRVVMLIGAILSILALIGEIIWGGFLRESRFVELINQFKHRNTTRKIGIPIQKRRILPTKIV